MSQLPTFPPIRFLSSDASEAEGSAVFKHWPYRADSTGHSVYAVSAIESVGAAKYAANDVSSEGHPIYATAEIASLDLPKYVHQAQILQPSEPGLPFSHADWEEDRDEVREVRRIDQGLQQQREAIVAVQAEMRGAMMRFRLSSLTDHESGNEGSLVDLQSRIRGEWARGVVTWKLKVEAFSVKLQSAVRGFLLRSRRLRHRRLR